MGVFVETLTVVISNLHQSSNFNFMCLPSSIFLPRFWPLQQVDHMGRSWLRLEFLHFVSTTDGTVRLMVYGNRKQDRMYYAQVRGARRRTGHDAVMYQLKIESPSAPPVLSCVFRAKCQRSFDSWMLVPEVEETCEADRSKMKIQMLHMNVFFESAQALTLPRGLVKKWRCSLDGVTEAS